MVGVFGHSASLINNLGFVTNWGRVFGPYGGSGGAPFKVELQFTAAKSEESMDILHSFFTTLDFLVAMWTDVAKCDCMV